MYSFVLHYVESVIQQFSCKCLAMTDKQLIRSCGRQNVPLVTKLKSTKGLHLLHNFSETTNTVISLTDSRNPSYLCVMPLFMRSLRQCPWARINHCALLDVICIKLVQFAGFHVLKHYAVTLQLQLAWILQTQ